MNHLYLYEVEVLNPYFSVYMGVKRVIGTSRKSTVLVSGGFPEALEFAKEMLEEGRLPGPAEEAPEPKVLSVTLLGSHPCFTGKGK